MADWAYAPLYPYKISYDGPEVLVAKTADNREIRRVISTDKVALIDAKYRFNQSEAGDALDFFDAKGFNTTFTILAYNPQAATPDTSEYTVRFTKIAWQQYARNRYSFDCKFRVELT